MPEAVTVRTFKYNGRRHRSWSGSIDQRLGSLLILKAIFEEEIRHPLLGIIESGTQSIEYYWFDRWYNVFCFLHPNGEPQNFYCNVTVPPVLVRGVLSYIDLDMDILVAPDLSFTILDEAEFEQNAERYGYPGDIRAKSHEALAELVSMIETRHFPFHDLK